MISKNYLKIKNLVIFFINLIKTSINIFIILFYLENFLSKKITKKY